MGAVRWMTRIVAKEIVSKEGFTPGACRQNCSGQSTLHPQASIRLNMLGRNLRPVNEMEVLESRRLSEIG